MSDTVLSSNPMQYVVEALMEYQRSVIQLQGGYADLKSSFAGRASDIQDAEKAAVDAIQADIDAARAAHDNDKVQYDQNKLQNQILPQYNGWTSEATSENDAMSGQFTNVSDNLQNLMQEMASLQQLIQGSNIQVN